MGKRAKPSEATLTVIWSGCFPVWPCGCSPQPLQDELFPGPNSTGIKVSAKTRGCAEVIWGQVCRLSPVQEELTAMGQPPG